LIRARAVILGTLSPRHHAAFTVPPPISGQDGDRYSHEREVLKLAEIVHVPGRFSLSEQLRARAAAAEAAAAGDLRLRVALKNVQFGSTTSVLAPPRRLAREQAAGDDRIDFTFKLRHDGLLSARQLRAIRMMMSNPEDEIQALEGTQFGFTQTIAAAPQLIERWRNADPEENPYAYAVLAAAVDAARLGVRAPLSDALLRAAAPGYCNAVQRARVTSEGWFERAVDYATQPLLGATAALVPVASPMMIDGQRSFRAADYLVQFASAERALVSPPASFWEACAEHLTDATDLGHVGSAADDRLLFGNATPLLRRAVEGGETRYLSWLCLHLANRGELDQLVNIYRTLRDRQVDIKPEWSIRLATVLISQVLIHEAADEPGYYTGTDVPANRLLVDVLDKIGAVDGLRSRANDGDVHAAFVLRQLLKREASEVLDSFLGELGLDSADGYGDKELKRRIQAAPDEIIERLTTDLKQISARLKESKRLARSPQASGLPYSKEEADPSRNVKAPQSSGKSESFKDRWDLAELLIKQGKQEEAFSTLRDLVDAGDQSAALRLSELLAEHGRSEEALDLLRSRVAVGDRFAFIWLDYLLAERGETTELWARAEAADPVAREQLVYVTADHLAAQDRHEEAFALLRSVADAGNRFMAMGELAEWLNRHGRSSEAKRLERYGLTAEGAIADAPATAVSIGQTRQGVRR